VRKGQEIEQIHGQTLKDREELKQKERELMRQIQQLQDEVHQKGTQATRATQKAENALNLNR
jgi:hypothetical protein